MKNLLTKILFISLLLPAAIPSSIQADFFKAPVEKLGMAALQEAVKMGIEIGKVAEEAAKSGGGIVAQEGPKVIPIEVVVGAAVVPSVVLTAVVGVITGDPELAVAVGKEVMEKTVVVMALAVTVVLAKEIIGAITQ